MNNNSAKSLLLNTPLDPNYVTTDPTAYNFSDVYMFSDEEGGAPFSFGNDGTVVNDDKGIPNELQTTFNFIKPKNVEGGLIIGLKGETGLVFLGDLVDNQYCSIQALRAMCVLKEKHGEKVLLIGGNRDFNKIRMGLELFFKVNDKLPWEGGEGGKGVEDFAEMVKNIQKGTCKFRESTPPQYFYGVISGWNAAMKNKNGNPGFETFYKNTENFHIRLSKTFTATMGVGAIAPPSGIQLLSEELNNLFPKAGISELDEETKAKVICAAQMLMSFFWEGLPAELEILNGLYLHYLRRCHALAYFTIGDKKGLVSHGGFPMKYKITEKNGTQRVNERILTSPFGYKPTEAGFVTTAPLFELITNLEAEKNTLVKMVNSLRDIGYTNQEETDAFKIISKFVHLTALTVLPKGANSKASPIVGFQFVSIQDRVGNITAKLKEEKSEGGALEWINANLAKNSKKYLNTNGVTIDYDIFGHMPQGFLPTAYREAGTTTLHVNLDISKTDGQANNFSFAFLHLKSGQNPEFIGRFRMPSTDAPFNNTTKKYKGAVNYYKETIPDSGEVKLLKDTDVIKVGKNQNGKNIVEKYAHRLQLPGLTDVVLTGFARSYKAQGGRRGKKHSRKTHKAKRHHKKRGTRRH